jgi:hypothetical protein
MARKEAGWDEKEQAWTFRGSFFGGCMHSLVLALRGNFPKAPTPWQRSRFAAGTQSEDAVKEDMVEKQLATLGPPEARLGVVWDAGAHYSCQRQVRAYFAYCSTFTGFAYPRGIAELRHRMANPQDGFPPEELTVYRVGCSLDGWGIGARDYVANACAAEFYEDGVLPSAVTSEVVPFVLEHKSMNDEKKAALDACCTSPYVLCHKKFRELMRSYGWQVTGQAYGVTTMCAEIFQRPDGVCYPLDDLTPVVFISVEVIKQHGAGGVYFPTGRYLYMLDAVPYDGAAVAERLATAVDMAKRGVIPECDSEWDCSWTKISKPVRNTKPPELSPPEVEIVIEWV